MKQFITTAILATTLILSGFTHTAHASAGPYVKAVKYYDENAANKKFSMELRRSHREDVVELSIRNLTTKKLFVTLQDADGSTIDNFCASRKIGNTTKQYNFSGAEPGIYTITITDGTQKIKKEIKIENVYVRQLNRIIID